MNISKQKQAHREHTSGYQWRERSGDEQGSGRGLSGTNYYV